MFCLSISRLLYVIARAASYHNCGGKRSGVEGNADYKLWKISTTKQKSFLLEMKETKLQAFELAIVTMKLLIKFSPTKSCVRYLDPQLQVGDNYLFLKKVYFKK